MTSRYVQRSVRWSSGTRNSPLPGDDIRTLAAVGSDAEPHLHGEPPPEGNRPSFWRAWLLFGSIFAVLTLLWSLGTPLPSGPDEPAQYNKAAAVARGNLTGRHPPKLPSFDVLFRIPAAVVDMGAGSGCYYGHRNVSAACRHLPPRRTGDIEGRTYVGYYPPLYYAMTGWPSLFGTSTGWLRAMRGAACLLGAVLLGLSFAVARRWSRHRLVLVGLALAVTPATIYLISVLNPSGLEVAAATALWTSATILFCEYASDPPVGLVRATAGSALVLAFTRPASPVWVVVVLGTLVLLRPAAAAALIRSTQVRIAALVVGAGVVLSGAYVLIEHSYRIERFPVPASTTSGRIVRLSLFHLGPYLRDLFGAYGSPDTTAPAVVVALWGSALAVLLGIALLLLRRREAVVLVGFALVPLVVVPMVADVAAARSNGIVWQGRYHLPLAVGIPILAAVLLNQRVGERGVPIARARLLAPVIAAAGLIVSFYWVQHRYQVGLAGPLDPFPSGPGVWQPPVSPVVLLPLVLVTATVYAVAVVRSGSTRPAGESRTAEPAAEPVATAAGPRSS